VKYAAAGLVAVAGLAAGAYYATRPTETPTPTKTPTPTPKPVVTTPSGAPSVFILKSDDFEDEEEIPPRFTCDGENVSPQLSWKNMPEGTKSFALSVIDVDAPGGTFVHWLIYDIPSDVREIEEGGLPTGAKQLENDFGKKSYGGPCPPSGKHRYIFTLYALDIEHLEDVDRKNFLERIEKHSIGKAELTGLYARR